LTSKGDLNRKLEYAFDLYDADRNGYLDKNEVREVVTGMLDLLGADKKGQNSAQLAEECIRQLDASKDGKVTKAEFINGLLKNYSLRALMSPFN
jgi:Ca2+-binding EF-hand superfamily protein